ncbi:unnamed protein product [Gordionus sp. m RMFG-2023]
MDSTSFDLPSTSTSHQEMSGIETQPMSSPIREIEEGYKVSRSDNSIMIGNNYKMTPKKTRRKCRSCCWPAHTLVSLSWASAGVWGGSSGGCIMTGGCDDPLVVAILTALGVDVCRGERDLDVICS